MKTRMTLRALRVIAFWAVSSAAHAQNVNTAPGLASDAQKPVESTTTPASESATDAKSLNSPSDTLVTQAAGIADASPATKLAIVEALTRQNAALDREQEQVRIVWKTRKIGPFKTKVPIVERVTRINRSKSVVAGAIDLVNNDGAPSGLKPEPEQLKVQVETIRWVTRPVVALCKGKPWIASSKVLEPWKPILQNVEQRMADVSRSVGIVRTYDILPDGKRRLRVPNVGTAIVVGPRQVITNKHVFAMAKVGYQNVLTKQWVMFSSVGAEVEFPSEYDRCDGGFSVVTKARVVGITYADPSPDVDFIVLTVDQDLPAPVRFVDKPDIVSGDRIAVLGYPGRPELTFLQEYQIDEIFQTPDKRVPFPIARVSLGYILPNPDGPEGLTNYDATTWGGSSGSVVMSLVDGSIIALHVEGLDSTSEGIGYNRGLLSTKIAEWQRLSGM